MKLSNEYLATLLDNISEAIVVTDKAYQIVYFNRVAEQVFGYGVEEILGRPLDLLLPERFVEIHLQHCREFMAASQTIGMMKNRPELVARRKDGTEFPVKIGLSKIAQGGEEFCTAIVVDITELTRVEDALRKSREKSHALIEHSSEGITLVDAQGILLFGSPAAERMFGYPRQEPLGQSMFKWIHPDDLEHAHESFVQLASEPGSIQTAECRVQRKDGIWRWVEAIGTNLLKIPAVQSIVINYRDITERKQAEDALRERERQMTALVRSLDDVVFEVDAQGSYRQVWTVNESLLARPKSQLLGKGPVEVWEEEKGRFLQSAVRRVLASGHAETLEYPLDVPSGTRWFMARISPILVPGESPHSAVVLVRDVTERKRAEEKIKALNQELAALNRAGQAMASTLDLDMVLGLVMKEITGLLDAEGASVLLQEGDELVFVAAASPSSEALIGMRLPVTAGIVGWVMQTGKAALVGEAHSDPRFDDRVDAATGMTTHSLLAVPLMVKGVPRGVIETVNKTGQAFDEHDLELLEGIARPAAIAIENARLFSALGREKERLQLLYQMGRQLSGSLEMGQVAQWAVDGLCAITHAQRGVVMVHEPGDSMLRLVALSGYPAEMAQASLARQSGLWRLNQGLAGWVAAHRQMALSDDVTQDERWIAIPGLDDGVRSALCVPLVSGDMLVGALSLYSDQAGFFDEDSRRLVESAAAALAAAIANARLYQQEREQFRRLQQSQAQLIHAEKMAALGRLTASIAHEINNPLQAVLGCLALIHDDLADPDLDESQRRAHTQHDLQVAEVEIKRIADIVRRLREFYQPAHEDLRATHLQSILENLLVLVRKQLQNSGISVELVWGQLPELYTNPDLLKQVFLNLVLNAIDAMPGGGTLRVRTALEQATLRNSPQPTPVARVEFSDTGAGIPPELLSRVFEPFFTTKEHGSGLGLSISYEIVASLGGEIAVTSEVGKGTTFAVLLPMHEMQGAQRKDH